MKKVCVTGGAGFIGSHVVDSLVSAGYSVFVIDNLSSGNREVVHPQAKLIAADIRSDEAERAIAEEQPEYLIHLAAQVDVSRSLADPVHDADSNILGTIKLLQLCQRNGVRKIVYSSSCAAYGETENCSITESFPIQPLSFYGISKSVPEAYIRLYRELYGLDYCILRYANVYGPRQTPKGEGGAVAVFLKALLNGSVPRIFGSGEQTRDFVYVKDVARANILAMEQGNEITLNIGTDTQTSVNELFHSLSSLLSFDVSPLYAPARKGDIRYSRLSRINAHQMLGWQPAYSLEQGLAETIQYAKQINQT